MSKRTYKIQVLLTETELMLLNRMKFWEFADGNPEATSMSKYARSLLIEQIDKAPKELKQSIKNAKR